MADTIGKLAEDEITEADAVRRSALLLTGDQTTSLTT
jgi:hypothetical protein